MPFYGEYCRASFFAPKDSENGPIAADTHLIIENIKGDVVGDIGTGECNPEAVSFLIGLEIKKKNIEERVMLSRLYCWY